MSTILETLEAEGMAAVNAVRHAAAWLVGASMEAQQNLNAMEAASPLVAAAVAAGIGAAKEHGVPVDKIEATAEDVLEVAKAIQVPPAPVAESTAGPTTASSG